MPEAIRDPNTGKFLPAAEKPTTETPAEKPAEAPPEDMAGAIAFSKSFLSGDNEPTMPPEEKEKEKPKPAAKPALAQRKPAPKPKPAPSAPALTAADIATATAEAVTRVLKPDGKKPAKPDPDDEPALPAEDQRRLATLAVLEQIFPDKYKGLADRYQGALKKLADYAKKWETAHPGETFDEDAPEHKDFIEGVNGEASWEDDDYIEAVAEQRAQKLVTKEREATNSKLSEFEREKKLRDAAPLIFREQGKAASQFWQSQGEEFKDLILESGLANHEKLKALQEKDPVAFGMRVQMAEALDLEVGELHKILGLNGAKPLADYDPKNPIHANLEEFTRQQEKAIAQLPPEDQQDNEGRSFLPSAKFWKLSKAERENHWTFDAPALSALRAKELAVRLQEKLDSEEAKLQAWAKARGLAPAALPASPRPAAIAADTEPPDPADDKPLSPSIADQPRLAGAAKKANGVEKDPATSFVLAGI